MREDAFSAYHPAVSFLFFAIAIAASALFIHPVFLGISFLTAFAYQWMLQGWKKTVKSLVCISVPMMLVVMLMNPMFNHYGMTILFYLRSGNPVTLESMIYGAALGMMLCQMLIWFRCFHQVMTSDKFVYLFGRLLPALSLILAMCLRFVPKLTNHMELIRRGQKCIGRDVSNGSFISKVVQAVKMLSMLVTWALEHALQTADSMKSRGYGTARRSAYALYRIDRRDCRMLAAMGVLAVVFIVLAARGAAFAQYNSQIMITGIPPKAENVICYLSYFVFCLLPVVIDVQDNLRWKKLRAQVVRREKGAYRLWEL